MIVDPAVQQDAPLVSCLLALASPPRLAILRQVRTPRALREVVVRDDGGEGAPLARQTVRKHLDTLVETGLVTTRSGEREYGETTEFVVNHQRIFHVSDEVRNLARMRPTVEPAAPTMPAGGGRRAATGRPAFVLVRGLDEGTTYDLRPTSERVSWSIGRRRGLAVSLDYDPSVSGENAIVRWERDHHTIEDVPGSLNGTSVNFERLASGERARLSQGDIVGIGRSLLVYWA